MDAIENRRLKNHQIIAKVKFLEEENDFFGLCDMLLEGNLITIIDKAAKRVYGNCHEDLWKDTHGKISAALLTLNDDLCKEVFYRCDWLSAFHYDQNQPEVKLIDDTIDLMEDLVVMLNNNNN